MQNQKTSKAMKIGIIFMKSRKSEQKIKWLAAEMIAAAQEAGIHIVEAFVDRTEDLDNEREQLDPIMTRMENGEVKTVIVKSIYDISRCKDDIQTFLQWAAEKDVEIISYLGDMPLTDMTREVDMGAVFGYGYGYQTKEVRYTPQYKKKNIMGWVEIENSNEYGFNLWLVQTDGIYGDWYILRNKNNGIYLTSYEPMNKPPAKPVVCLTVMQ